MREDEVCEEGEMKKQEMKLERMEDEDVRKKENQIVIEQY